MGKTHSQALDIMERDASQESEKTAESATNQDVIAQVETKH